MSTFSGFQNIAQNFLGRHSYTTSWLKEIGIGNITGMVVNIPLDTELILKYVFAWVDV